MVYDDIATDKYLNVGFILYNQNEDYDAIKEDAVFVLGVKAHIKSYS